MDTDTPQPSHASAAPVAEQHPSPERFFANICPGLDKPIPEQFNDFARAVVEHEKASGRPTLVLAQNDEGNEDVDCISEGLFEALVDAKLQLNPDKRVLLILHTFGGDPNAGYKIATWLQKKASGFDVLVPKCAKSAGTLISLGARRIFMADMAELGPLDMQVKDTESDLWDSALNETKSLQTLSGEAFVLYLSKMELLHRLTPGKRFETRNRIAVEFVNEMIRPLVEKIDAVHYTKMARIMEIMKRYGTQLMARANYAPSRAARVIESLSNDFPDHAYIIDSIEARHLGLRIEAPPPEWAVLVEKAADACGKYSIVGRIARAT